MSIETGTIRCHLPFYFAIDKSENNAIERKRLLFRRVDLSAFNCGFVPMFGYWGFNHSVTHFKCAWRHDHCFYFYLLFYQHHQFGSVYFFFSWQTIELANSDVGKQTHKHTMHPLEIVQCQCYFIFRDLWPLLISVVFESFVRTHPKLKLKLVVCGSFVCQPLNSLCIACANNDIATPQLLLVT